MQRNPSSKRSEPNPKRTHQMSHPRFYELETDMIRITILALVACVKAPLRCRLMIRRAKFFFRNLKVLRLP
jgi:hypothetical protein